MHHLSVFILHSVVAVGCDHNWDSIIQTPVSVISSVSSQSKKTINLAWEERGNLKTFPSAFVC